jgi:GNAT superfamily N-acetyltransferase
MTGTVAPAGELRFTSDYEETVLLEDGTVVVLRLVRPDDAPLLLKGFGELSAASRYLRFFGVKSTLSPAEVAYLSHVDGWDHFALGAALAETHPLEGVGVARFIRLKRDPEAAEFAIAVVDRLQGRGLGRILLERLIAAARERRIKRFVFDVLSGNARMVNLVHDVAPDARRTCDGPEVHFEVALDHHYEDKKPSPDRHPVLHRLLALVASGLFGEHQIQRTGDTASSPP